MSRIKIAPRSNKVETVVLHTTLPDDYSALFAEADAVIRTLTAPYPRTTRAYDLLIANRSLDAHWNMANYTTVMKLNYNDHGPIHARVTCAYALKIMTLLVPAGVIWDVVKSGTGDLDDAFLVVLVGVLLHDIGNALHRNNHESMGVILAQSILQQVLPQIYPDIEQQTLISDFISSTVQTHDMNPVPLFMEGALVAVADGCDMTKGRARTPFDLGKLDIHAVSALSIEEVKIKTGRTLPVEIEVSMSNSAGIFQVEQTLVSKLNQTALRKHVTVRAMTVHPGGQDKRIIDVLELRDGRLTPAT